MSYQEYTAVEEGRVWQTIQTLRQMRFAGQLAQKNPERTPQVPEVLKDAEELAKRHAFYLVHLLAGGNTPEMLKDWEELEAEMETKYHNFAQVRRSPLSDPLMDIRTKLSQLNHNNPRLLTQYFTKGQFLLGDIEFTEMADDKLGILAPLSTDLFVASLIPPFMKLRYPQGIPTVKPVLASTDLKTFSFPKDENGQPVFANMDRVLGFVDANGQGNTRMVLADAAKLEYPGKVIPPLTFGSTTAF